MFKMFKSKQRPDPSQINLELAQALRAAVDRSDWQKIVCEYNAVATIGEADYRLTLNDGSQISVPDESGRVARVLMDLREAMATPQPGAWYKATATLQHSGEFEVSYDYDNEPVFSWTLTDADIKKEAYLEDHRMYPRNPDELPEWHPARQQ